MKKKADPKCVSTVVPLGANPVNLFQARQYALESSPSPLAVIIELTENARDNATDVVLIIDAASVRKDQGQHYVRPRKIICTDNGTGLTHLEFRHRFCGAYSDSEHHHEVDRAGRNGVGTKTYLSVAERVVVRTTTGRPTEGINDDIRNDLQAFVPAGVSVPENGEPDTVWRAYEFSLHESFALPAEWKPAEADEMGTVVELSEFKPGTEILWEPLIERLGFNREWLQQSSHNLHLQLCGDAGGLKTSKPIKIHPWHHPERSWLTSAKGRSNQAVTVHDPSAKDGKLQKIEPNAELGEVLEFDFRVVGKGPKGNMETLPKPALLLEICGALPYAPNLESNQSARTLPLLSFLGLANVSSIGAFKNSVCGYARINALTLKESLRNNKTTLATGPGAEAVEMLRDYLRNILWLLHRAWYSESRSSQDEAAKDALIEAGVEVNMALQGVNRNPFKGGDIVAGPDSATTKTALVPTRHHRWECGACRNRWLAKAEFTPTKCAESDPTSGIRDGCGSSNIGLAKNQPRIGECQIRTAPFGDPRVPATFQFEQVGEDQIPVVEVNDISPRYVELRESGSLSSQAEKRLKQYLIDTALVAIAEYRHRINGTDVLQELGQLYYNRMLRLPGGFKQYQSDVSKLRAAKSDSPDVEESFTEDSVAVAE